MESPQYAFEVFRQHLVRAGMSPPAKDFIALEIGPGDVLNSMLVARAFGASRCYLVDEGPFARTDPSPYREMNAFLAARGFPETALGKVGSIDSLLRSCRAAYLTEGVRSFRLIPSESIDFAWSHAVLEHIARAEFFPLLAELHRVLGPSGVASHTIDLTDHLGGGLNHLRFSHRWWESGEAKHAKFYTNRLRYSEMLEAFSGAGFVSEVTRLTRWEVLPTPRSAMAKEYRAMPEAELLVSGFDVVLRRR